MQLTQDEELIKKFSIQIEKLDVTVEKQMMLERKAEGIDNPGQARPIRVTFDNATKANDFMKNLNRHC